MPKKVKTVKIVEAKTKEPKKSADRVKAKSATAQPKSESSLPKAPQPKIPSLEELLETGVHFGHQVRKWNPKTKPFVYAARQGIHIIDLTETHQALVRATEFLREKAAQGARIVFVATKRQAAAAIKKQAQRAGVFYLNERWVGGLLTNFSQTKKPIQRLAEIEKIEGEAEKWRALTTKEQYDLKKEKEKLEKLVGGLRGLDKKPEVLVLVDPKRENTAVREAVQEKVPLVALLDTNADPEPIDYPIPGNDDALKSIELILSTLAGAILEGKRRD